MKVRVIRNEVGFAALEDRWDELLKCRHDSQPFYSWAWYWAWWKHFGAGSRLFTIVGEDDTNGEVVLIAPFRVRSSRLRSFRVSELSFLENGIGPRNTILFHVSVSDREATDAVLKCLAEHKSEWDIARLSNVEISESWIERVHELKEMHSINALELAARHSPYIAIGDDFELYFTKTFRRKQRYNIRRTVKHLLKSEDSRVIVCSERDEIQNALEKAFRVSAASWKGLTKSDMAGIPARRAFYTEVTNRLAGSNLVRVWILEHSGSAIAIQYQLVANGRVYLLVSDFDEAHSALSPGTTLLYEVIQQLHQERYNHFDFCGNAYGYKLDWATGASHHVTLELFNRRWYSNLIFTTKNHILPTFRKIRDASLLPLRKRSPGSEMSE